MDDSQRARFVHVTELMKQIAEAVGIGQRTLVTKAQTTHGTLAVKTADITVEFAISSATSVAGIAVPGVGANTLFGLGISKDQQSSKASISLQIVPIVTQAEGAGVTGSSDQGHKPGTGPVPGIPGLPGRISPELARGFKDTVRRLLQAAETDHSLSAQERGVIVAALEQVRTLAGREALLEAAEALQVFGQAHAGWLARQKGAEHGR